MLSISTREHAILIVINLSSAQEMGSSIVQFTIQDREGLFYQVETAIPLNQPIISSAIVRSTPSIVSPKPIVRGLKFQEWEIVFPIMRFSMLLMRPSYSLEMII